MMIIVTLGQDTDMKGLSISMRRSRLDSGSLLAGQHAHHNQLTCPTHSNLIHEIKKFKWNKISSITSSGMIALHKLSASYLNQTANKTKDVAKYMATPFFK